VIYTVSPKNEFIVDVEATADQPTPFSLTHHSYFNLAGEGSGESIESHELEIFADDYAPTDANMGLLGRRQAVTAANDFRKPRKLSEAIPKLFAITAISISPGGMRLSNRISPVNPSC